MNDLSEIKIRPAPLREEAARFLTLLDPAATAFTFQTFDDLIIDGHKRDDPKLRRIFHGTLDKYWDTLVRLNSEGAGVFVTINETDLKGRRIENIKRIRAVWCEDDGGRAPKGFRLAPSL